ncbi:hypothetical protein EX30DRAFT_162732 [Ascodesmis nigricans]|uniref:Uncharacterized protein n=1 Tax=Ascodesmis nigricans TaxID=341454 RepID=A0A4V3SI12_9PEZI|nr:hypothetical protein EX30DRAFT_162732 [Ascodesmis nigricans]
MTKQGDRHCHRHHPHKQKHADGICDIKPSTRSTRNEVDIHRHHHQNYSVNGRITPPRQPRNSNNDNNGSCSTTHQYLLAPNSAANESSGPAPRIHIRPGRLHTLWALNLTQPHFQPCEESQNLSSPRETSLSSAAADPSSPRGTDMAATVSTRPQLWTKSAPSTADLFSNPPPATFRPKATQKPDPVPVSGSLWTKKSKNSPTNKESTSATTKPTLWRAEPEKSLWNHHGEEVTLEDLAAARREVVEAWPQERGVCGLFANQSDIQTARSKCHGVLPKVEDGLWRKKVENEENAKAPEARHTTLWVGRSPPTPISTPSSSGASSPTLSDSSSSASSTSTILTSPSLWSPGIDSSTVPSLFAHLSMDSIQRSKRETSANNLPKFSEELWKAHTPLPLQPSLWTPPIKPTGLWTASPTTIGPISLQDIAAERKYAQKLLWSRKRAQRTTDAPLVERTHVLFRPSHDPLPVMSGPMWKKTTPPKHSGLWKRNVAAHTVAPGTVPPQGPLWNEHTARRTTSAKPGRSEPKPQVRNMRDLPKFTGPMWTKPPTHPAANKKLWDKDEDHHLPPAPKLWNQQPARITTITKPERIPAVNTTFSLSKQALLWSPPSAPSAVKVNEASTSVHGLWSPTTAQRTTTHPPIRPALIKRPPSTTHLEKATGALWGEGDMPPALTRVSTFESDAVSDGEDDGEEMGFAGMVFGGFGVLMGGWKGSEGESGEGPLGEWLWKRKVEM